MEVRGVGPSVAETIGSCESLDLIAENQTHILWKSNIHA